MPSRVRTLILPLLIVVAMLFASCTSTRFRLVRPDGVEEYPAASPGELTPAQPAEIQAP